jgi:DNA-binding response OmpR family regulator
MLIYSVVTSDERQSWKNGGHPLNRHGVVVEEFVPGSDLKERLLKTGIPELLVLDESLLASEAIDFLHDLTGIKAWEQVPVIVLSDSSEAPVKNRAGLSFLQKPVNASAYEELIKTLNLLTPRRYPRRNVMAPCALIAIGKRVDCRIRDISISGCKIDLEGGLKTGSMVQIAFSLKFELKSIIIKTTAKVVREIKGGYGLAFTTMDTQSRSIINSYIKG